MSLKIKSKFYFISYFDACYFNNTSTLITNHAVVIPTVLVYFSFFFTILFVEGTKIEREN